MLPTLYCLAASRDHAEQLVARLQSAGVPTAHLSALILSKDPHQRPAPLAGLQYVGEGAPEEAGSADKAAAGAATGTAAGAAAGVMTMSIVGLTPLLMIAPLMVTAGAAVGAAMGATAATNSSRLADFGIPEDQQDAYGKKLAAGSVLVAVRTEDEAELEKANAVMTEAGASDLGLFRLTKKIS